MTDYKFTGDTPQVMTGLVQGVNALCSNENTPYGSTVVCQPGDTLHTDERYDVATLEELADDTGPDTSPPNTAPDAAPSADTTTEQEPTE